MKRKHLRLPMSLKVYREKRNLAKSKEPKALKKVSGKKLSFVIQKHFATHLHYDFRLEVGGVLKSWAVPKGLSKTKGIKRIAVMTEDHPKAYGKFEGTIPEGSYGAGKVIIWDKGTYRNLKTSDSGKEKSMKECLKEGKVEVWLYGEKFTGAFALIRLKETKNWLIFKVSDSKFLEKSTVKKTVSKKKISK